MICGHNGFSPLLSQVEKTKHYLLLREKLESTLLTGQEPTLSCVAEELNESPQPSDGEQEVNPASEITTERQRELATKVSVELSSSLTWGRGIGMQGGGG